MTINKRYHYVLWRGTRITAALASASADLSAQDVKSRLIWRCRSLAICCDRPFGAPIEHCTYRSMSSVTRYDFLREHPSVPVH